MRAGLEERQALREGDPVLSEATVVAAKSGWEASWRRKREHGEALGGLVVQDLRQAGAGRLVAYYCCGTVGMAHVVG